MSRTALDLLDADEAQSARIALERQRAHAVESRSSQISSLTNPSDGLLRAFGGIPSKSGVAVTYNNALSVPAVNACVELISGIISRLPIRLMQDVVGGVEEVKDHPVLPLITDTPDGVRSAFKWRRAQDVIGLVRGNAPTRIIRDDFYQPIELKWMNPVELEFWQTPNGDPYFRYRGEVLFLNQDVLLHTEKTDDGVVGKSPLTLMRETLGLSLAQEEFAGRFFSNGGHPGVIFTAPAAATAEQVKLIKAEFEANHRGLNNSNRMMVIGGGVTPTTVPINNTDAQFLEGRSFSVIEVCMFYGTPPHLIGMTEKSTSFGGGIESQNRTFLDYTIGHRLTNWCAELGMALLTQDERIKQKLFFEFDTTELTNGTALERAQTYQLYRNIGVMSVNDIREREGMRDLPDNYGDRYDLPFNGNGGVNAASAAATGKGKPQQQGALNNE